MKIRTQIIISIIVSALVIAGIGTLLFFNYQQLAVASENEKIASNIVMGSYALSNLQNDYLLGTSDRARLQWEEKYATLQDDFTRLRITDPVQRETEKSILESNRQLKEQFSKIAGSPESNGSPDGGPADPELVRVRWNRLGLQTQGMIFDASRLSEMVKTDVVRIQQENDRLVIILISALLVVMLMNLVMVNRRILHSLESLRKGTGIIGSGNLDYAIDESSNDEIGELSHAFNQMTLNLKGVTASKADLEKEVIERKRAEQSAKESLELYQTLAESAKDIIFICDPAGNLQYFNKNGAAVFGTSVDDLIGKNLEQAFPPEIAREQKRHLDLVLESKKPLFTEINIPLPKIDFWLDVQLIPIFTEQDTIKSVMGVARDITPRKKAEEELKAKNNDLEAAYEEITATGEELRQNYQELEKSQLAVSESEERFRALFEEALDGICLADAKTGIILDCNQALVDLVGRERAELIGQPQSILHPPHNDDLAYSPSFSQHLTDKKGQTLETQVLTKTGKIREVDIKANLLNIRGQEIMQGIFRDITERKQVEVTLRESEERFRIIFERSTVGKSLTTPDGRLLKINRAFADMLGYTIEEMQQLNFARITVPEDIAESKESIRCLLANERTSYRMEKRYIHKGGRIIWADVSTTLLKNNTGAPLYFITSIIDITRQKEAEESLKKYSEKLEETVNARTRELREAQDQLVKKEKLAVLGKLSGGVGHELRNPLGAIKNVGYFLTMALENPDEDIREMIDILNKEVARSEDIISSLLDFARPKVPVLAKVDMNQVMNETLKRFPVPQNVTLINTLNSTLPRIRADSNQLIQVFGNLVTNAYQAMPEGGILTITSTEHKPGWIALSVEDTGAGISDENMKKIFEPLFTTKAKGIGLGLVVIKTIIEAHGGRIEVKSEAGKGAVFTVVLPISGNGV
jgi:PAS domain S-box-containing protein